MLGASQVGKSSLCAQFLSSEHINAYDKVGKNTIKLDNDADDTFAEDSVCKEVSVAVNDAETRIIFVEHEHGDMSVRHGQIFSVQDVTCDHYKVENQLGTYCPDAFLVVLAVDDISSLDQAERILAYIKMAGVMEGSPCILVANKTDLVRNRVVKSSGGSRD